MFKIEIMIGNEKQTITAKDSYELADKLYTEFTKNRL